MPYTFGNNITFDDTNYFTRRDGGTDYGNEHWHHLVDLTGDIYGGEGIQFSGANGGTTRKTAICAAANYSGGGGGKGVRFFKGTGASNQLSASIEINLPSAVSEFWCRYYQRYEPGTAFVSLVYIKDFFGTPPNLIWGRQGSGMGVHYSGANVAAGDLDWYEVFGNPSDGAWHCFEYHIKSATPTTGVVEGWIDNVKVLDATGLDLGDAETWDRFWFADNQSQLANGQSDYWMDMDDIVFSVTGRIGLFEGAGAPARRGSMSLR